MIDSIYRDQVDVTLMDNLFSKVDDSMRFSLWVAATQADAYDYGKIVDDMNGREYEMEWWIVAMVSYNESLKGNLDWISLV